MGAAEGAAAEGAGAAGYWPWREEGLQRARAAAGSAARAPGKGWLPSSSRGNSDPGSERERREEVRDNEQGGAASGSGATAAGRG